MALARVAARVAVRVRADTGVVASRSPFLIPTIAAAVPGDLAADTIASATQRLDSLSRQSGSLAEKYNAAQFSTTGALLTSTNETNYLDKVTALNLLDEEMVKHVSVAYDIAEHRWRVTHRLRRQA